MKSGLKSQLDWTDSTLIRSPPFHSNVYPRIWGQDKYMNCFGSQKVQLPQCSGTWIDTKRLNPIGFRMGHQGTKRRLKPFLQKVKWYYHKENRL